MRIKNPERLAELEVLWAIYYHKRDWSNVSKTIIALREEQYQTKLENEKIGESWVEACMSYIGFKNAYKDGDKEKQADALEGYKIHVREHYQLIEEIIQNESN